MTSSTARVFLSYARKDGEAFATALRRRLERDHPDITLWQDRARLEGGIGWWNQIEEALDAVQFLVLVMTPGALQSPMTRKDRWRRAPKPAGERGPDEHSGSRDRAHPRTGTGARRWSASASRSAPCSSPSASTTP